MSLPEQFHNLFEGNRDAYGKYHLTDEIRPDGKRKGRGETISQPLDSTQWKQHLNGEYQLGVTPINADNKTKFGAIDIDEYDLEHMKVQALLNKHRIPVVMCRSKSGGAHLYMFTKELVPASLMQNKLREISSLLGYGTAEIFPKQSQLLTGRGDVGNWINMPYKDGPNAERVGYSSELKPLTPDQFLRLATQLQLTTDELTGLTFKADNYFKQGPPCLETIEEQGPDSVHKGNTFLFNVGVFFSKRYPDTWKDQLASYNKRLSQPLSSSDFVTLLKSVDNKEYFYTCSKEPICSFCNKQLCKTRKFGITGSDDLPAFDSLTKLTTDPPIWFLSLDTGERLELSTDELQKPHLFQKRCMDVLNIMPKLASKEAWNKAISLVLQEVNIVDVPREFKKAGQIETSIYRFLTTTPTSESLQDLGRGMVYEDEDMYYFTIRKITEHLTKEFDTLKQNTIIATLNDLGIQSGKLNIAGAETRVCQASKKKYPRANYEAKQFSKEETEY